MNQHMNPMNSITPLSLNAQLKSLSQIISNHKSKISEQDIKNYLDRLFYFTYNLDLKFNVNLEFNNYICLSCTKIFSKNSIPNNLKLECGKHAICSEGCAFNYINLYTENEILNFSYLHCVSCKIPISRKYLENLFGLENFRKMLLDSSAKRELNFTCDICSGQFPVSQGITLNCEHRFCQGCLREYVELLIQENKVSDDELCCPQGDNSKIDHNIIQYIVSAEVFEKFLRFRLVNWRPELDNDELYFECHGVNCENRIILEATEQEYKCHSCGFVSCPRCGDVVHKGVSCDAFRQWKQENDQADIKFQELMKNSQWINCPWCRQVIERISGCKYMTCFSSECRGKKYLCFDCKQGLAGDHAHHPCVTP